MWRRFGGSLLAVLMAGAGCTGPVTGPRVSTGKAQHASASPTVAATPSSAAPAIASLAPPRVVPQTGTRITLSGQARLIAGGPLVSDAGGAIISDHGAGLIGPARATIISDHGAGVISNANGRIVSNNGGGLIGNNGGGLIGNNGGGYRVLADAPAPLATYQLADAKIDLFDASGQRLVDEKGHPLEAVTGPDGQFELAAVLPKGNLVARIALFGGGELSAMVVPGDGDHLALDLDTATTMGAAYVLEQYVQGKQAIFDRLPAAENDRLSSALDVLRTYLVGPFRYDPRLLAEAAGALRTRESGVDAQLERIRAILLAGQANLGDGLLATTVTLDPITGLAEEPDGGILIGEYQSARIRRLRTDGTLGLALGQGTGANTVFGSVFDVALGPDGDTYVADSTLGRVRRFGPDGTEKTPYEPPDLLTGPIPTAIALSPAGQLAIAYRFGAGTAARIRLTTPDGGTTDLDLPADRPTGAYISDLAFAADGRLAAAWLRDDLTSAAFVHAPTGAWSRVAADVNPAGLAFGPEGQLYVTDPVAHRVLEASAEGASVSLAGDGHAGRATDGTPAASAQLWNPQAILVRADGTIVVGVNGTRLVQAFKPGGAIVTLAGTEATAGGGDALAEALSGPDYVAIGPAGEVVFMESRAHLVRRLVDGKVVTVAGSVPGDTGDGGPATEAKLFNPDGLAYDGSGQLYVADRGNFRIRRIGTDGRIDTVAGGGTRRPTAGNPVPALEAQLSPRCPVVTPAGVLCWIDADAHQICRLVDGRVELVAGDGTAGTQTTPVGDGGPATAAVLPAPARLAVDATGALYVVDDALQSIRRIAPDGTINTFAGLPLPTLVTTLALGGAAHSPYAEDLPARQAGLLAPTGMAFGPDGALYFAERGPQLAASFGALGGLLDAVMPPNAGARIRKITPDGHVKTVTGFVMGQVEATQDLALKTPNALAFDREGRLVIADTDQNQLKVLPASAL